MDSTAEESTSDYGMSTSPGMYGANSPPRKKPCVDPSDDLDLKLTNSTYETSSYLEPKKPDNLVIIELSPSSSPVEEKGCLFHDTNETESVVIADTIPHKFVGDLLSADGESFASMDSTSANTMREHYGLKFKDSEPIHDILINTGLACVPTQYEPENCVLITGSVTANNIVLVSTLDSSICTKDLISLQNVDGLTKKCPAEFSISSKLNNRTDREHFATGSERMQTLHSSKNNFIVVTENDALNFNKRVPEILEPTPDIQLASTFGFMTDKGLETQTSLDLTSKTQKVIPSDVLNNAEVPALALKKENTLGTNVCEGTNKFPVAGLPKNSSSSLPREPSSTLLDVFEGKTIGKLQPIIPGNSSSTATLQQQKQTENGSVDLILELPKEKPKVLSTVPDLGEHTFVKPSSLGVKTEKIEIPSLSKPLPTTTKSNRVELDFISTDPAENADNFDPAWEARRILETDSDKHRDIRKRWRNLAIPDPKLDLTYRRRTKQTPLPAPKPKINGSTALCPARKGHVRQLSCTSYFEESYDEVSTTFAKESKGIIDRYQLEFNHMRLRQQCEIEGVRRTNNFLLMVAVDNKIEQEHQQLTNIFQANVRNVEERRDRCLEQYVDYMNEVRTFSSFYAGVADTHARKDASILSEDQAEHAAETKRMYEEFKKFYLQK